MLHGMARHLLTIGRFAQLTGLTIRALRLYDELGLLRPEAVDGASHYRYYAGDQLARGELIRRLRRADLPLAEIGRFLDGGPTERERILADHRARLRGRVAAAQDAVRAVDGLREEAVTVNVTPMTRTTLADQPVLRVRWELPEEAAEEYPLAKHFGDVAAAIERQGLTQSGPPYCVCAETDEDGTVHGEAGIPVDRPGRSEGRVEAAILPGGEVGSTRYTGPSGTSGDGSAVVRHLWSEIVAAGLVPDGEPRWIYHSPPDVDPAEQVSELVWAVTR